MIIASKQRQIKLEGLNYYNQILKHIFGCVFAIGCRHVAVMQMNMESVLREIGSDCGGRLVLLCSVEGNNPGQPTET